MTVELASQSENNRNLERRLEAIRQSLQEGSHPWTRRFESLAADRDTISWELEQNELRRWGRKAEILDAARITDFFAATDVYAELETAEQYFELRISPGQSSRATRQQRKRVESAMEEWTQAIAEYLVLASELFDYLDDRPERARASLGALYADYLEEDVKDALPEITDEEEAILERLDDSISTVWQSIREIAEDDEYSIEELSRLAYDPFPAPLTLEVEQILPGTEGFETSGKNFLFVPGLSLWSSLESLEGRWLSHDPLLIQADWISREDSPRLELDELLGLPRTSSDPLPEADEIEAAIEQGLSPAPLYRVRWARSP